MSCDVKLAMEGEPATVSDTTRTYSGSRTEVTGFKEVHEIQKHPEGYLPSTQRSRLPDTADRHTILVATAECPTESFFHHIDLLLSKMPLGRE